MLLLWLKPLFDLLVNWFWRFVWISPDRGLSKQKFDHLELLFVRHQQWNTRIMTHKTTLLKKLTSKFRVFYSPLRGLDLASECVLDNEPIYRDLLSTLPFCSCDWPKLFQWATFYQFLPGRIKFEWDNF